MTPSITIPFGFESTAAEVLDGVGLDGKTAIVTGEQGAATSALLAGSPLVAGVGGRYFEDCQQARIVDRRDEFGISGVAPYALDPANAERLWAVSLQLTGAILSTDARG